MMNHLPAATFAHEYVGSGEGCLLDMFMAEHVSDIPE
jgi:hypothetical protein